MSRSAIALLLMTLTSMAALCLNHDLPASQALLLKCASAVFGVGFLGALMAGRRFKFDPVLR